MEKSDDLEPPPRPSILSLPTLVDEPRMPPLSPMPPLPKDSVPDRKAALVSLAKLGIIILLSFWISSMWIFGSLAGANSRVHRLRGYIVDYDGGAVGQALLASLATQQDPKKNLGWVVLPASRYSIVELTHQVRFGHVWAAMWVPPSASAAFNATLSSPSSAAAYDPRQAIFYAGSEARYPAAFAGYIYPNLVAMASSSSSIFQETTTLPLLASLNSASLTDAQRKVLICPISTTFINLAPWGFSARVLVNTAGKVIPVLFQFFLLLNLDPTFVALGLSTRTSTARLLQHRYPIKLAWAFLTAASSCSFPVIVRESDDIDFKLWVALFGASVAYCLISWSTIELVLAFIDSPYVPLFIFPMVLTSGNFQVASCIFPIELSNNLFRVNYLFPSHTLWQLEIMIYGRGATGINAKTYIPVMVAWLVVGEGMQFFAMRKRSRGSFAPPLELH